MATDVIATARKAVNAPLSGLDALGEQLAFFAKALAWTPRTIRRYKKEVLRLLSEVVFGSGSLAVIGGTVGVIAVMCFFTGTEVGLQGYAALNQVGVGPLTGFISAFFNTREIAPLVAGLALSATVGCGFTAQLGAMRISEEIDALEVMAIPSIPYLVTTRIVGAFTVIVPLYLVGLFGSYLTTKYTVTIFFGQSAGTYEHYFNQFLRNIDVFYSVLKVIVFTVFITIIHTYYGYNAAGGLAGVGRATVRVIRATTVIIAASDVLMTMLFWGLHGVRLGGG